MIARRPEFVEFRNRIKRLVDSLVTLRNTPLPPHSFSGQERVEVKLESESVIIEFFVAQLSWDHRPGVLAQRVRPCF